VFVVETRQVTTRVTCEDEIVGELANLTTKIITLLEFFNFVSKVSRLQYE
jgi:hypothetical protein